MEYGQFSTPPENQGQIVEVSYAACGDMVLCRSYDRSTGEEKYYAADIEDDDWDWYWTWEALNGEPPISDDRWRQISASAADRICSTDD